MRDALKYIWKIMIVLMINGLMILILIGTSDSVPTLSRYGSRGEEVTQIQTILKEKGYYSGNADGIFGEQTRKAVIAFQKDNGLSADGIAGEKTLAALGLGKTDASGEQNQQTGGSAHGAYSASEVALLARIISAEARGEPYEGQVAVGAVIMNRIAHPSFPNTLSGVIYQPGAFSCLTDGGVNAEVVDSAYRAAKDAIDGSDPSGGAVYYYNPSKTSNQWMHARPVIVVIGSHRFCSA